MVAGTTGLGVAPLAAPLWACRSSFFAAPGIEQFVPGG